MQLLLLLLCVFFRYRNTIKSYHRIDIEKKTDTVDLGVPHSSLRPSEKFVMKG